MAPSSDQLPLDVNYAKLAEWLIIRQKLPKDWHRKLQIIDSRATEAAQSLPPSLKAPAEIDYVAAKHIRDSLAETSERSLFGGLVGPASVWDKIVRALEKDNIFMGECSLTLARNVDYEIPFFKRQAGKYQQQLSDLERKRTEHLHSAALAARAYQQECQTLGIQGVRIRSELYSLVKELPGVFSEVARKVQAETVADAMQYYAQFLTSTSTASAHHSPAGLLPTMAAIRKAELAAELSAFQPKADGDVPAGTASRSSGKGADVAEATEPSEEGPSMEERAQEGSDNAPGEISWDIDLDFADNPATEAAAPSGGIEWDIDVAETADAGQDQGSNSVQMTEDSLGNGHHLSHMSNHAGGIISQLVNDGEVRSQLLNELHELAAFLRTRAAELASSSSSTFIADAHDALQDISAGRTNDWLQDVEGVIKQMTDTRVKQLLLYKTSAKYLDRMTAALQQKAGQEAKFRRLAHEVEGRRQGLQKTLLEDARKLAAVLQETKDIKSLVEDSLASQLNRPVLVVGEIYNALE